MTQQQAGDYYLTQVCKVNEALNKFNWQMFRGKERVTLRQIAR